jgi:hypothetical protein
MGFVLDKQSMRQVLLQEILFSSAIVILQTLRKNNIGCNRRSITDTVVKQDSSQ